jgi:hypothetical protein
MRTRVLVYNPHGKLDTTDWYWARPGLTLRYIRFSPPPDFDPVAAYTTAKDARVQAYQAVRFLERELRTLRERNASGQQISEVSQAIGEAREAYRAAKQKLDPLRPLVKIAICPYCQTDVWKRVGIFSLSDRSWYNHESDGISVPRSSICDHLFCISGGLGLNGHSPGEQHAFSDVEGRYIRMAAGVPFVLPRLLKLGMTAVLHAIPVAQRYTGYPVTYFTQFPFAEHKHFCIPWGSERFDGMHPHRDRYIGFTGTRSDKQEYDLAEALIAGRLQWLDPQTQSNLVTLQMKNCPYEQVSGRQHPYKIDKGIVQDLPDPLPTPAHIQLGDLDESFDR